MSAWIVQPGHIDVLVAAARSFGLIHDEEEVPSLGQMLWDTNAENVMYLYPDDETARVDYTPTAPAAGRKLHPAAVLAAIACYEYQCSDMPGWDYSDARAFCVLLGGLVLLRHRPLARPVSDPDNPGLRVCAYKRHAVYDAAPWGFDSIEQAYTSAYEQDGSAR